MRISDWSADVCSSDLDNERFSRLRFRYPAPSHAEAYQRYFRIPVAFAQPCNAIELPRVQLDAALDGGIPALHGQAEVRVAQRRSEEHTSELQSLMRISYAVFCLKKKKQKRS